jgi:hypothetical protein
MKPTEFIIENSTIAQEADDMHRDHEVQMARSQMYSAAQAAIEIHRLLRDISEMEGLEGWVQSKLTLASQYLESVRDYMKYEAVSQEPEMMTFAEEAADYALESLVNEVTKDYVEKNPEKFNEPTRNFYARNTARSGGDEGLPGARSSSVRTGGDIVQNLTGQGYPAGGRATRVERPEGVPTVSKKPITSFGGGGGGVSGHLADPSAVKSLIPNFESKHSVKESATGGSSSAGGVAISMGGPGHKPTSGVPKKLGNAHKAKKIAVGKGVYDK